MGGRKSRPTSKGVKSSKQSPLPLRRDDGSVGSLSSRGGSLSSAGGSRTSRGGNKRRFPGAVNKDRYVLIV